MTSTTLGIKYRAQVLGIHGNWVDGGLFTKKQHAERDTDRLSDLYDRPTRIVETQVAIEAAA